MSGTLYDILEIPIGSKEIAIKRAYRRLSFKHHPDTGDGNLEALQKIQDAYERLSDETKRAKYDAILVVLEEQKKAQEQAKDDPWNTGPNVKYPFGMYPQTNSGGVGYYGNSGSSFASYGYNPFVAPKTRISFRVDDVIKYGLTGLSSGQTVYISVSITSVGAHYSSPNVTMSLSPSGGMTKAGTLVYAHYGAAPGLPVYGDFEVEF